MTSIVVEHRNAKRSFGLCLVRLHRCEKFAPDQIIARVPSTSQSKSSVVGTLLQVSPPADDSVMMDLFFGVIIAGCRMPGRSPVMPSKNCDDARSASLLGELARIHSSQATNESL